MLPRGLTARVLTVAVLGALSAVPIVIVPVATWVSQAALDHAFDPRMPLSRSLAAECERDPRHWAKNLTGSSVYAYDVQSGHSANPNAPALDGDLYAQVMAGHNHPSHLRWALPPGGRIVVRPGESGPCSLLMVTWSAPSDAQTVHWRALVGIPLMLMFVVGLAAILFAIRPLVRRIRALEKAAARIGDEGAFVPVNDPTDDALGRLAGRITDSHRRIVAANLALRERAVALQEHLSDVAHDVRTPLAALQLRLEQLAGNEPDAAPVATGQRQELLDSLEDVLYLTSLTENLRLASQLQEDPAVGPDDLDVDVRPIVRRVVNRFAALGALRSVRVRGSWPDDATVVRCHPAALEQALTNLVQNAVIYGSPASSPASSPDGSTDDSTDDSTGSSADSSVTVLLDRLDGHFELAVIDDGPGVAPEVLPRLAERRFRGDQARSRGPTGSGLGLAIVAAVCERNGWSLEFESVRPSGLKVLIAGSLAPVDGE